MEGRELGWEAGAIGPGQTSPHFVDDLERNIVHLGGVAYTVHTLAHWISWDFYWRVLPML